MDRYGHLRLAAVLRGAHRYLTSRSSQADLPKLAKRSQQPIGHLQEFFIPGQAQDLPSNTQGGSRVRELRTLGCAGGGSTSAVAAMIRIKLIDLDVLTQNFDEKQRALFVCRSRMSAKWQVPLSVSAHAIGSDCASD